MRSKFLGAALAALLVLVACDKPQTAKESALPTSPAPTVQPTPYVILESHASKYVLRKPVSESAPEPSTYVIRHGNVVIQAHCGVLARYDGKYDKCTDFPTPFYL